MGYNSDKLKETNEFRKKNGLKEIIYTIIECWGCKKDFKSEGIHNKFCDKCRDKKEYV